MGEATSDDCGMRIRVVDAKPETSGKYVFGTMNGLRGMAALVVVIFHCSLRDPLHLKYGYLAVDMFFALSGFVIAHSYDDRLRSSLTVGQFFAVRMIRLYPLYLCGTLIAIMPLLLSWLNKGYITAANAAAFHAIPYALLMMPAPPTEAMGAGMLYPLNVPAWSLASEIVVNMVYAATLRFWTPKRLVAIILCAALLYTAMFLKETQDLPDIPGGGGWQWSDVPMGFVRVFYSFPCGVLIYRLYKQGWLAPVVPVFVLFAVLPSLFVLASVGGSVTVPVVVLVGFPLLVACAATAQPNGVPLAVCNSLGAASYAIYALHWPLLGFVSATLIKLGADRFVATSAQDAILIILLVPIGFITDRAYDGPVRRLLGRWFGSRGHA